MSIFDSKHTTFHSPFEVGSYLLKVTNVSSMPHWRRPYLNFNMFSIRKLEYLDYCVGVVCETVACNRQINGLTQTDRQTDTLCYPRINRLSLKNFKHLSHR